jgi:SAM-dependent methyltransferase
MEPVERFDPKAFEGELVEAEHLARYHWAASIAEGREVLDAGCGEGYGGRILSNVGGATRYVGVDLDPEAVARARDAYGLDGRVELAVADVTALPFEDASFDLVTCFETIEHVAEQQKVVSELARVLREDGLLLISSPNRDVYPPGNPHHVRELTPAELEQLLSGSFSDVILFRQHNWLVSAVLDDEAFSGSGEDRLDLDAIKLQGLAPGQELYTLAACGKRMIDPPRRQALITHGLEVRRWIDEINRRGELIDEVQRLGAELARTRAALAASERELLELRDRRSTAMGRLERQSYWLERGQVDLDAWMRRRPLRLVFQAASKLLRGLRRLRRR